jgi:hypothetical protein
METVANATRREPCNKGKRVGDGWPGLSTNRLVLSKAHVRKG